MTTARTLSVSLIVPVSGGGAVFQRCLESLCALRPAPDELLAATNGASAEAVSAARQAGARVLEAPGAEGPAAARNRAAREARGDILFFVDADVTLPADAVDRVRRAFGEDGALTALFGSYDDSPADPGFLSQYRNLLHHHTHQNGREEAFTFWGACGAVRREAFDAVGGFSESYGKPSIEDIELGYRLKRAGLRIKLLKDLQVKHWKRWTWENMIGTDFLRRALPWAELILAEGRAPGDLNLNFIGRASVALVGASLVLAAVSMFAHFSLAWALAGVGGAAALNGSFYFFLARRKGALFAVRAVPCHLLYYLIGGAAFALAAARRLCGLSVRARGEAMP